MSSNELNNSDRAIINETDPIKALENFSLRSNSEQKPGYNLAKMKIYSLAAENLSKTISASSEVTSKLSNRILWLNILLGIFTIIGTILSVIGLVC